MNAGNNSIVTNYTDGNNLLIQLLNKDKVTLKEESSFVSYQYQKESPRPAFAFEKLKNSDTTEGFISILYPFNGNTVPEVKITENSGHNLSNGIIDITVSINGKITYIKQTL